MLQHPTELVITLVASVVGGLAPVVLKDTAILLRKSGGKSIRTNWLEHSLAADIFCAGFTADQARAHAANYLKDKSLDIIVQPVATRRKKLLLADMESTVIQQEMLDELADLIGKRDEVVAITARAMNGEIDFAGALKARVALLKGQSESILTRAMERITPMPGALELVAALKLQGVSCWLVSGGFTCFAEPVAAKLGFDRVYANTLVVRNGVVTGEVEEPILDKIAKQQILEKGCAEISLAVSEVMTVGDGANDIPMLAACNNGGGLGVAYHAKSSVREAIPSQINHADLKALFYAQGYGKERDAA
jgi:phosphoserine phosphatase